MLTGLPPVQKRIESAIHEPLLCQLRTPGPTPSTRSPLTLATGLEEPQTCRSVFNLEPLMRGPLGKVPEGLLSRNQCVELLPREAVHDSPTCSSKSGCHICAAWRKRATLLKARAVRGKPVEDRVHHRITPGSQPVSGPSSCGAPPSGLCSTRAHHPQR